MMKRAVYELDRAGGRIAGDLRDIIADSEDLLRVVGGLPGEGLAAARTQFEGKLRAAKQRLVDVSEPALEQARQTAAVADDYVHGNPWASVGAAMAAGALIGFLASRR